MYNHFEYCETLCKQLKPFSWSQENGSFFRATEQTEMHELNENISSAQGMIMIAINPSDSQFSGMNMDTMSEEQTYAVVIVQQTSNSDTETILQAQADTTVVAKEIIKRIMCDARAYKHFTHNIYYDTFHIEGIGPIGDSFYGVMLSYSALTGFNQAINPSLWH